MSVETSAARGTAKTQSDPRTKYLEILQLISVLVIPVMVGCAAMGSPWWIPAAAVAAIGFIVPLWLVRPDPEVSEYEITESRLATLEAIKIPPDIREAMRDSMLHVGYASRDDFTEALYTVVSEQRAREYVDQILPYARVYQKGNPPEKESDSTLVK